MLYSILKCDFLRPQNVGIDKGDIPDLTKVIIIEVLLTKEKLNMV
jgi:hypothetical protein